MPIIRPSSDLRNKYVEISDFCHKYLEPIYITKNGKGDLAVLSIEAYELLIGKNELRKLLMDGVKAEEEGRVTDFEEAFKKLREL